MNTFQLIVASPEGNLFQGEALRLSLRGANGDLAVLAGHVPFISPVQAGSCRILLPDDTLKEGYTDGGLLTVSADAVTLLSDSFRWETA